MDYFNNLFPSLTQSIGEAIPGVAGAIMVLIIGLFVAWMIKKVVLHLFKKVNIDEKIGQKIKIDFRLDQFIAKMIYYLVVVYTLLIVLGMMGLNSVLAPIENMLNEFLSFIPNLISAGIIGFVGYLIAKIVSEAAGFITNTLEPYALKAGFKHPDTLSSLAKKLIFILVFLPILIVALDTLKMKAISVPATEMLGTFLNAIPNILAAVITIGVFYVIGKLITGFLVDLLRNVGTDKLSQKMGISRMIGHQSLVDLLGKLAFAFILFTGIITGVEHLGMSALNDILNNLFQIAGQIFFGLIILAVGAYLANLIGGALKKSTAAWMAPIAKFAVIGIFLAFALHTMGIAESIVNLAFGLTLGAAATAFALAFGLGGREVASKQLNQYFNTTKKEQDQPQSRNERVLLNNEVR